MYKYTRIITHFFLYLLSKYRFALEDNRINDKTTGDRKDQTSNHFDQKDYVKFKRNNTNIIKEKANLVMTCEPQRKFYRGFYHVTTFLHHNNTRN